VYAPVHWTLEQLLHEIKESVDDCQDISLMHTYSIRGFTFPYTTINSMHNRYKKE